MNEQPSFAEWRLMQRWTFKAARAIVGTLSFPSKLPGSSYSLPARECVAGQKLVNVPGSVCKGCYALRTHHSIYTWPNPLKAQYNRLASLDHPQWVEAMAALLLLTHSKPICIDLGRVGVKKKRAGLSRLRYEAPGFHRWHDSGDLQSTEHFAKVCEVARLTPRIRHWLSTQELGFVRAFVDNGGIIPRNLVVRVSNVMMDDHRPRAWPHTSSVFGNSKPPSGVHACPALRQGHRCLECRACWQKEVAHVVYELH